VVPRRGYGGAARGVARGDGGGARAPGAAAAVERGSAEAGPWGDHACGTRGSEVRA